ncbi:hypothetical protein [Fusobacterium canifelinum]|uniref:Uncharacterized protein n=1 Tax=Fusobacterium canifelinum TaxID=285729 RepID=A0A3P1V3Y2_9FUSO|nr:hypothetical protein [Fusobacterium canifelinum]QQB73158.1 hypothetical protein I6H56_07475 [Fusobacterium canifelinum]RRD28366.1 hypothetical protein EII27_01730 [Fusobacterium canifelinum]
MSEKLSNEDNKYLLSLIKEDKIIEAVKFVREKTDMSLKQAKEYVDMKRINENTEYPKNNKIISEDDEEYIFSLLKENKKLQAIAFLHKEKEMSLEEAKNYVDKKEFKNKILNEKTPYKRGYFFDKKLNIFILDLSRQRKVNKIIFYILLIFITIPLIQLCFLDKTSFNQMLILFFCISFIIPLLIIWLALTLNIYITEKRINKIEELELPSEFEIKSLKKNGTLFFYIIIFIMLIFVLSIHINTLLKGLTYKSAFYIILLIGIIIFYFYNFLKELKNRKYSLNISGKTVKIFYKNNEINTIKTDNINHIKFYSTSKRTRDSNPTLQIFDNEEKALVEMTIKREDYHILTMYFIKYNVFIEDKYNKL